jgi:hypothetical protein
MLCPRGRVYRITANVRGRDSASRWQLTPFVARRRNGENIVLRFVLRFLTSTVPRWAIPHLQQLTGISFRPMAEFPVNEVCAAFPTLHDGFIFFDNAAGAQVPRPYWTRSPTICFIEMFKGASSLAKGARNGS